MGKGAGASPVTSELADEPESGVDGWWRKDDEGLWVKLHRRRSLLQIPARIHVIDCPRQSTKPHMGRRVVLLAEEVGRGWNMETAEYIYWIHCPLWGISDLY